MRRLGSVMVEGQMLLHYRILGRLGEGAMGVVCKAQDLKLNRTVALKCLSAPTTSDPGARLRLLQEARAASQLDHPNICRIHTIEELDDGQVVLVLSFHAGETLAAHIARAAIPLNRSVTLASQLLAALQHAHAHGVIHRDVKPSNIIITPEGELMMVDFGLAKGSEEDTQLTDTGAFMGTVSYMSPEQVLCREVDYRSDLWAAGAVFYEMLTGQLPFSGGSPFAVCDAILRSRPRNPSEHRPELPAAADTVVMRALARDVSARYRTAMEFREALGSLAVLSTGGSAPSRVSEQGKSAEHDRSLAVLPFECGDGDGESEYFCDGLADEIITGLSAVRSLRVICSSSSLRLKGRKDSPLALAGELHVRNLLKGTVWLKRDAHAATALRVNVQLIDPHDDCIVWGGKHRGTLEDVFSIQESIAREIVEALRLKLSPSEDKQIAARPLPEAHAYQFYLQAKHEILRYTREALERALALLEKGEALVGANALLLAAKGQVYWQFLNAGISSDPEYLARAKQCGVEAVALDPQSAHAIRLLGLIALQEGDTQRSVRLLKKCITLDPNDSDSLSWYCALCALSGKSYAAMPHARRITAIDPLTPVYRFIPGLVDLMNGDFDDALPPFDEAILIDPTNAMLRWSRGQILAMCGRRAEAIAVFDDLQRSHPDEFFARLGGFLAAALQGEPSLAEARSTSDLCERVATDPHFSWAMAQGFAVLDQPVPALHWLCNAVERGFLNYPMMARLDPFLRSLRGAPGFDTLVAQARDRWERFEVD